MSEVVYFSVNNWFCGRDYPPTENFKKWLGNDLKQAFRNDEWAKENKLCIYCGPIDMSMNYTIAAPREWVEENCPELLTDDEYTYITCIYSKDGEQRVENKAKYSDFVDKPDEYGDVEARFGWPYLEYKPENFGVHWYHDPDEYCDDDEDDDEEEEDNETLEEQPEEKEEEPINQEEDTEDDDDEDTEFSLFSWLSGLFRRN